jgi:shikimate kinase
VNPGDRNNIHDEDYPKYGGLIFLIGFMGSGKTFWGKKWAKLSGLPFFDIDEMIERDEGRSATTIFAEDGESYFRNLETDALRSFAGKKQMIIATGGGTPCFNDNITWMNSQGITTYLKSAPSKIFKRLVTEKETRPLVKHLKDEELLFYITEKIKERDFFYNKAKVVLDVDNLSENYVPDFLIV